MTKARIRHGTPRRDGVPTATTAAAVATSAAAAATSTAASAATAAAAITTATRAADSAKCRRFSRRRCFRASPPANGAVIPWRRRSRWWRPLPPVHSRRPHHPPLWAVGAVAAATPVAVIAVERIEGDNGAHGGARPTREGCAEGAAGASGTEPTYAKKKGRKKKKAGSTPRRNAREQHQKGGWEKQEARGEGAGPSGRRTATPQPPQTSLRQEAHPTDGRAGSQDGPADRPVRRRRERWADALARAHRTPPPPLCARPPHPRPPPGQYRTQAGPAGQASAGPGRPRARTHPHTPPPPRRHQRPCQGALWGRAAETRKRRQQSPRRMRAQAGAPGGCGWAQPPGSAQGKRAVDTAGKTATTACRGRERRRDGE